MCGALSAATAASDWGVSQVLRGSDDGSFKDIDKAMDEQGTTYSRIDAGASVLEWSEGTLKQNRAYSNTATRAWTDKASRARGMDLCTTLAP